ncbi:hypothetical protein BH10ACI1_BH10ACI1_35290 [soil metagenome]
MLKTLPQIRPAAVEQIDRTRDLEWLKSNRQNFIGQWIALFAGELLASGSEAKTVLQEARAKGFARPLLVHIQTDEPFSGGWM